MDSAQTTRSDTASDGQDLNYGPKWQNDARRLRAFTGISGPQLVAATGCAFATQTEFRNPRKANEQLARRSAALIGQVQALHPATWPLESPVCPLIRLRHWPRLVL